MTRTHPVAWCAWLGGVAAVAFMATNPYALGIAMGAVWLVHLASPPEGGPLGRAVAAFVKIGIALLVLRLVFVGLLSAPGATTLAVLPRLELPRWAGGFGLGGRVTAEVLVEGTLEGTRLLCVLAAFGIFNGRVDAAAVMRSVPPVLRDAGLVVSVALAFVPGILRTASDVRDAQRLRGERGVRRLGVSLAVPVLGMSLERSMLLAESMDLRGYGRAPAPSRALTIPGMGGLVAAVPLWMWGRPALGSTLAAAGAALIVWSLVAASRGAGVTRMAPPRWTAPAGVIAAAGVAAACAAVLAAGALAYTAYPVLRPPGFQAVAALPGLLLAVPAVVQR
jgi:energy-coupling factor transport system permease protein